MSTRSSIWLGESKSRNLHIYWELAEREVSDGKMMQAPIYIAVDGGDVDEVAIRLPKEIAIRLLMALTSIGPMRLEESSRTHGGPPWPIIHPHHLQ
jgi:hypothetical protein